MQTDARQCLQKPARAWHKSSTRPMMYESRCDLDRAAHGRRCNRDTALVNLPHSSRQGMRREVGLFWHSPSDKNEPKPLRDKTESGQQGYHPPSTFGILHEGGVRQVALANSLKASQSGRAARNGNLSSRRKAAPAPMRRDPCRMIMRFMLCMVQGAGCMPATAAMHRHE